MKLAVFFHGVNLLLLTLATRFQHEEPGGSLL